MMDVLLIQTAEDCLRRAGSLFCLFILNSSVKTFSLDDRTSCSVAHGNLLFLEHSLLDFHNGAS